MQSLKTKGLVVITSVLTLWRIVAYFRTQREYQRRVEEFRRAFGLDPDTTINGRGVIQDRVHRTLLQKLGQMYILYGQYLVEPEQSTANQYFLAHLECMRLVRIAQDHDFAIAQEVVAAFDKNPIYDGFAHQVWEDLRQDIFE